jgi:exonuclease III
MFNIFKYILISSFLFLAKTDSECPNVQNPNQDRRNNSKLLRLVQYNVEWLFVDYYSNFDCPGSCTWKNESEALKHLDNVAQIINKLNPDIINLCEVEGCDELNMVIDKLDDKTSYKPYLKKGTDTSTGQNVGMITKIDPTVNLYRFEDRYTYPIYGSQCGYTGTGTGTETIGVSKHYITEYKINDIYLAIIGAHLLANPTDPLRCAEREAQAQVLQSIIYIYTEYNYEIIVIGDMNDFDGEILDINDNKPTSQVLNILKGNYGTYKDMYKLYSVGNNIEKNERYSDWYDSNLNCIGDITDYSIIDHILLSEGLLNKVSNVFIYHGYDEYCGKYDSDHYPIVVDFNL